MRRDGPHSDDCANPFPCTIEDRQKPHSFPQIRTEGTDYPVIEIFGTPHRGQAQCIARR